MPDLCPKCGSQMKRHQNHRLDAFIQRRRNCRSCDYADKVLVEPERIIQVWPVVRRRTVSGPVYIDDSISTRNDSSTGDSSHESREVQVDDRVISGVHASA
jgi:hypothetical protein